MSLEICKNEKGLFKQCETEDVFYQINPKAPDTKENLEIYKLFGKIIGKALFEQMTIPVQLTRLLTKQIVNDKLVLEDLVAYDKYLYKSLKFIKENTLSGEDVFEEYFVASDPITGQTVELKTNGANIRIDDSTKEEFLQLNLEWIAKKSIEKKFNALIDGLNMVIPKELF